MFLEFLTGPRFAGDRSAAHQADNKCKFCPFTYKSGASKEFQEHLLSHPEAIKCQYEGCSFRTTEQCNLDRHVTKRHGPKILCDKCGKSFDKRFTLERHIRRA